MRLNEILNPDLPILLEMPEEDLRDAENVMKRRVMDQMGLNFVFREHVKDRLTSANARDQYVSKEEIVDTLTKLINTKKGKIMGAKQLGKEYEAVVTNNDTDLNIAFAIDFGNRGARNLLKIITVMKKKNFKPYGKDTARFYV